jgi:hypothetical protein
MPKRYLLFALAGVLWAQAPRLRFTQKDAELLALSSPQMFSHGVDIVVQAQILTPLTNM